jgi:hypothetical protein
MTRTLNDSLIQSQAAMALEHCWCGHAQRSLRPLPSAASEQAWLQYFSPAETGQVQFGWAQRSWVASGMTAGSLARILTPKATQLRCHLFLRRRPDEASQVACWFPRSSPWPVFLSMRFAEISSPHPAYTVNRRASCGMTGRSSHAPRRRHSRGGFRHFGEWLLPPFPK